MGVPVDLTEQFRKAIKDKAISNGYSEAKLAELTSQLILPPLKAPSEFVSVAVKAMEETRLALKYVLQNRKEYSDRHRSTERSRDEFEEQAIRKINSCKTRLEELKALLSSPQQKRGAVNTHTVAHQHGMLLILSESLQHLTLTFDRLRSARFRTTLERSQRRRRVSMEGGMGGGLGGVGGGLFSPTRGRSMSEGEKGDGGMGGVEQATQQHDLLDEETMALQRELSRTLEDTRGVESRVEEMRALTRAFSTHVQQQTTQIEELYTQAVEATSSLDRGNVELKKSIGYNNDSRVLIILSFAVLTLAILFLDWYDSR